MIIDQGAAVFGRTTLPLSQAQRTLFFHRRGVRPSRNLQVTSAGFESAGAPWEILDVPVDADEKTIKRAYRQAALRTHPDVDQSPDAPYKFHKISEAYEMLMDRKRGKEYVDRKRTHGGTHGWSFHDWYWDFMLDQRQKSNGGSPKAKAPLRDDHLKGQLAGLRQRAARRKSTHPSAQYHSGHDQTDSMHQDSFASHSEPEIGPAPSHTAAFENSEHNYISQLQGLKRRAARKQAD